MKRNRGAQGIASFFGWISLTIVLFGSAAALADEALMPSLFEERQSLFAASDSNVFSASQDQESEQERVSLALFEVDSSDPLFLTGFDPGNESLRLCEYEEAFRESLEDGSFVSSNSMIHSPAHCTTEEPWTWQTLPDGLLWHSYMAGPHEPRHSMILFRDSNGGIYWDATLGGRVGLLRYGTLDSRSPQGWQWDFEGAVITRLNLRKSEDVDAMDYRFGTQITTAQGKWSAKFGYFHISSHVGDEYLVRHPTFQRRNYVTESLILGGSYQSSEALRLYGETAFAFSTSGGAKKWQIQTGMEYVKPLRLTQTSGPFAALNLDMREVFDFEPTFSLQAGWRWPGTYTDRQFRAGLQYLNGYTTQFQFFDMKEEYLGFGIWYDY